MAPGRPARGREHTGHLFWYAGAISHNSDALVRKADWAASQDTILRNTPLGPSHAELIAAAHDGQLDLRPPTMQMLGAVAQRAQTDHALTQRGHTPLGAAHTTVYVHARDLTATATNHRALRARDGHTPVQRRLHVREKRLSGVAVLSQPCLLCGGPEETSVHMHVGCAHSRLLWPHYRQAVQEAARRLLPGDKALWVASWRSAGAAWTEVFCSGLVPEEAEARARAIAGYDPAGGTSVDDFLHQLPQLGDLAWDLRNHRLEQLLREPLSAAARVHRWLTAAEGSCPFPPLRPGKDFVASLRVVNGTLECTPQEDPHPYRDLPGGFSKHLEDALFPGWIMGRGSMTAWEARIVNQEWARESGRWCAATRGPETPAQRYAAIPLEGSGPHTRPLPTMIRGAGPDHWWDAVAEEWPQAAPEPQVGRSGDVSSLIRAPIPPRIVLHTANVLRATEVHTWGRNAVTIWWLPPEGGVCPAHCGALQNWGACVRQRRPLAGRHSGAPAPHAPHRPCSRAAPGARQLPRAAGGVGSGHGRQPIGPPPPGLRGRVPVERSGAPPRRAPHVYGNPHPGGTPARRGRTSSPSSTTTGFSPRTRGRRSG